LQWGNAKGEPYTGNPYVRFDEGTEVVRPPPTLLVGATKALEATDLYIAFRHVLPNTSHVIFAKFVLVVAGAMLTEASLSFLGLGDPVQKSWGMMLNYAFYRGGFINRYWWWYLPPGLCISLAVLGFVLIGFGLEEQERVKTSEL
jgi:peptide/nickel transport system permease protein